MLKNLIYLVAGALALVAVAKAAPPGALIAAALALIGVVAILATLNQGPGAIIGVLHALTRLFHGHSDG